MKTKEQAAKDFARGGNSMPETEQEQTKFIIEAFEVGFDVGVEFANRWISVGDELPEEYKQVLIKHENGFVVGIYSTEKDYCNWFNYNEADCDFQIHGVTHWKPIEL